MLGQEPTDATEEKGGGGARWGDLEIAVGGASVKSVDWWGLIRRDDSCSCRDSGCSGNGSVVGGGGGGRGGSE